MATTEELRAELAVRELEDQLLAAKASDDGPPDALKLALREARRVHREIRAAQPAVDGEPRPDAIEADTTVNAGEVN